MFDTEFSVKLLLVKQIVNHILQHARFQFHNCLKVTGGVQAFHICISNSLHKHEHSSLLQDPRELNLNLVAFSLLLDSVFMHQVTENYTRYC